MKQGLIIEANGDKHWYKNNFLHREDGPAVELTNGNRVWYQNDLFHREDGPAVEYFTSNEKYWYINGQYINCGNNEDFLRILKLKAFL